MDEILTVSSSIDPLSNNFPLPEEMNESLPTVHPSSQKSSETEVKINISPYSHTEEEYTTHPSSETKEKSTTLPSPQGKGDFTTLPSSKTGEELNNDPTSEIGKECTTPLFYENEVKVLSQNTKFPSKDIRYEKTRMKKLKQHTNKPKEVVKKKV